MSKKIKVKLDGRSIASAIRELKKYQDKLEANNEKFVSELLDEGRKDVNTTILSIPSEIASDMYTFAETNANGDAVDGTLYFQGSQVAFVEFSAGVTYGTMPGGYPLPSGSGMGVGTYNPGSDNAWSDTGWFYMDSNGTVQHTYGNEAYMPMYYASLKMSNDALKVAKRVFT